MNTPMDYLPIGRKDLVGRTYQQFEPDVIGKMLVKSRLVGIAWYKLGKLVSQVVHQKKIEWYTTNTSFLAS